MGYGIKIQGSDSGGDYLVIDSDEEPLNYSVVATGTASSVDLRTGAGTTSPTERYFVLINIKGANFIGTYAGERLVTASTSGNTISFYAIDPDYRTDGTPFDFSVTSIAVDYILIKSMNDLTLNVSGNYGLQLKNSLGSTIFDSRKFNSSDTFYFSNLNPPRSISGDKDLADSILSTTNEYVDVAAFSYDIPVGSLDSGYWDAIYSPSSTSNTVKYSGVFLINEENVNDRGGSYRVRPNFFTIAVGDLR